MSLYEQFLQNKDDSEWFYKNVVKEKLHNQFHKDCLDWVKTQSKQLYRYMLTFTVKPDCKEKEDDIEKYIEKQITERTPLKIRQAWITKEYTKAGKPHWHCAIESEQIIKKDRFHYYIKKYGFLDISKTKAQNLEEAKNYISKDSTPKKLI